MAVALLLLAGLVGCTKEPDPPKVVAGKPDWMAAPAPAPPEPPPEVARRLVIGVIAPESGEEAHYGQQVLAGVREAVARVNGQGGILGGQVAILHRDDGNALATVERGIRELIQEQVVAIIAAPTGWSTFTPIRHANDSHTLLLAVGTRRSLKRSGPYVFRFALPVEAATEVLLRQAVLESGWTRFALVTSSIQEDSLTLSSAFRQSVERLGGEVVVEADLYDTVAGRRDPAPVVARLREGASSGWQAVLFTGSAEEGAELAVLMRQAGLGQPLIGGEDLMQQGFLQAGEAVRGSLVYASHPPERGGVLADRDAALAHDAVLALTQAITRAGELRSAAIREALLGLEGVGVTGRFGFTAQGEPVKQTFLYRVEAHQGGHRFALIE